MEANEVGTESHIALNGHLSRSIITRRTRNNNNSPVKEKDQENVNKIKMEVETETQSFKEETTTTNNAIKLEAKQQTSTSNINSSTPRRKKDPLANLHSNLSPKYIGFTTPPSQLDSNCNSEERSRSLRRRQNLSNTDKSISKESATDMSTGSPFTPNNESTLGYVRRTPKGKDSQATPDRSTKRKDFVSPIDKLLIKNGAQLYYEEGQIFKIEQIKNQVKREIEPEKKSIEDYANNEEIENICNEMIQKDKDMEETQEKIAENNTFKTDEESIPAEDEVDLKLESDITSKQDKNENSIDDKVDLKQVSEITSKMDKNEDSVDDDSEDSCSIDLSHIGHTKDLKSKSDIASKLDKNEYSVDNEVDLKSESVDLKSKSDITSKLDKNENSKDDTVDLKSESEITSKLDQNEDSVDDDSEDDFSIDLSHISHTKDLKSKSDIASKLVDDEFDLKSESVDLKTKSDNTSKLDKNENSIDDEVDIKSESEITSKLDLNKDLIDDDSEDDFSIDLSHIGHTNEKSSINQKSSENTIAISNKDKRSNDILNERSDLDESFDEIEIQYNLEDISSLCGSSDVTDEKTTKDIDNLLENVSGEMEYLLNQKDSFNKIEVAEKADDLEETIVTYNLDDIDDTTKPFEITDEIDCKSKRFDYSNETEIISNSNKISDDITEVKSNRDEIEISDDETEVKSDHDEQEIFIITELNSNQDELKTLNNKTVLKSNKNVIEISEKNEINCNQDEMDIFDIETKVKSNKIEKQIYEKTELKSNQGSIEISDLTEVKLNNDQMKVSNKNEQDIMDISSDNDEEKLEIGLESPKQEHLENLEEEKDTKLNASLKIESISESPEPTGEQNKQTHVKIEVDSVETESNNEFVDASSSAKSPSALSIDSAKGSSIVNEGSWMSFSTGDLYWGQIYNYCYWPCLVCPDPDGKTITTEENGRSGDQHIMVHVRFFADSGRRNWVKQENLMPYTTIENYQERLEEAKEKYGAKSAKFKLYVPTKKKEQVWHEAVKEANLVSELPYADRLEKFFELYEKSKAFQKLKNQRRKSLYLSVHRRSTSDMESLYSSNDNINHSLPIPSIKQKRDRSISPYSPAYSPIKPLAAKRRKLSDDQELPTTSANAASISNFAKSEDHHQQQHNNELNLSQTNSVASSSTSNTLNDLHLYNSLEFSKFYAFMKDFVMEQNQNDKLEKSLVVAVRNIWALKQLSRQQMERAMYESRDQLSSSLMSNSDERQTAGDGSVKRLSKRLKTLTVRKSLLSQQAAAYEATPERAIMPAKPTKETPSGDKTKKLVNRPILEVIDDIFELDNKYLFKGLNRDPVCKYCFKPGGNLKKCTGNCHFYLHSECIHKDFTTNVKEVKRATKRVNSVKSNNDSMDSSIIDLISQDSEEINSVAPHVTGDSEGETVCKECNNNEPVKCMVCKSPESTTEENPLVKCTMSHCDRAFHPACCKYWPQAKITISKNHIESFRCPSHVCHTCVSDDPKGKFQQLSNAKITKCVQCPATFHTDSTCIPAGSQILTAAYIICPRHSSIKHDMTVNVNWCFICVNGGQVVCCETCPTAVHALCLKIPISASEGYICEECESGRMPLYGEMVWAKFNNFRWWPAIILPPTEIPKNIAKKIHNPSDFVVRFFGTHDHGWISRRRVYLYLEGDSSEPPKSKSHLDLNYKRGVEEAKEVYEIIKAKKLEQRTSNENKEKLHPQPYVRIKANRAVPPVKLHTDIESVSKCECDINDESPCGPDTNCINRVLYHECNPKICPAGERCQNQMFESRLSPRLDVIYMKERGFGLISREPIKAGSFVIEYVGEIINDNEFQARMQQKSLDRDENFYFLSVEKDYIIDAGPKGNLARFMNHSCDPNCETQKWSVNALNRVGLFAIRDIPENTELTFNYHWDDLLGNEKKTCFCGAKKCAGQIGAKLKDIESTKEPSTSAAAKKIKSKTKSTLTKPVKRLLKGHKGRPVTKHKLNVKSKTKKMGAAVSAVLESKPKSKSSTQNEEDIELDDNLASTSSRNILVSPDLFC